MASKDGPDYWLERDFRASSRNSFQHQILIRRRGYLIDPNITSATGLTHASAAQTSSEPVQILDIGTRNGIWALETLASLESCPKPVSITGLDSDGAQFPARQLWPKDCDFDIWSLVEDVPEQYVGKFDIVHARLLLAALMFKSTEERNRIASNIARFVKPGGWIQWSEPTPPVFNEVEIKEDGTCVVKDETPPHIAMIEKFVPLTQASWPQQLGDILRDAAGFQNVKSYYTPIKKEFLGFEADLHLLNWEATKAGFKKTGIMTDEQLKEADAETNKFFDSLAKAGNAIAMKEINVIGQKPRAA